MDRKSGRRRAPFPVRLNEATIFAVDEIGRRIGYLHPNGKVNRSRVVRHLLAIAIRAVTLNPELFTKTDEPLGV